MTDTQRVSPREPGTYDKVYFWLGGLLPESNAWAQAQIRSRGFPLKRAAPVIATVLTFYLVGELTQGGVDIDSLRVVIPAMVVAVVGTNVFGERMRRREMRRYQSPGLDESD